MSRADVQVRRADYRAAADRASIVTLLDSYARDPMGGGQALAADVLDRLCDDLAQRTHAVSFIARLDGDDVGLANCFEAYSTFKARPLLNLHDIVVRQGFRGQGIGQALLAASEAHARAIGCCKLTLEVLSGNLAAMRSYEHFGFAHYQLDPAAGQAILMQKWL